MEELRKKVKSCSSCERIKDTIYATSPLLGLGNPESKIMVIFGAPEIEYIDTGVPLSGPGGDKLKRVLKYLELTTEDVWITCAVKHLFPPLKGLHLPTFEEIHNCSSFLFEEVEIINPSILFLLGKVASEPFFPSKKLSSLRGNVFEDIHWPGKFFCATEDLSVINKSDRELYSMKRENRESYYKKHKEVEMEMHILKEFLGGDIWK